LASVRRSDRYTRRRCRRAVLAAVRWIEIVLAINIAQNYPHLPPEMRNFNAIHHAVEVGKNFAEQGYSSRQTLGTMETLTNVGRSSLQPLPEAADRYGLKGGIAMSDMWWFSEVRPVLIVPTATI